MKGCLTVLFFVLVAALFVFSCFVAFVAGAKYGADVLPASVKDYAGIVAAPNPTGR